MRWLRDERGGVSAEFAVALPALLLVVGVIIGAIVLASSRVTLVSAAHDIARLEARGDVALASNRLAGLPAGVSITRDTTAGILCVQLDAQPGQGLLSAIPISGKGCAAVSDAQ